MTKTYEIVEVNGTRRLVRNDGAWVQCDSRFPELADEWLKSLQRFPEMDADFAWMPADDTEWKEWKDRNQASDGQDTLFSSLMGW